MHASQLLAWTVLGWAFASGVYAQPGPGIQKRQDSTNTNFPSLTTGSPSASIGSSASTSNTATSSVPTSTQGVQQSGPASTTSAGSSHSDTSLPTTKHLSSTSPAVHTASSTPSSNSTTSSTDKESDALPIHPRLTPAFGIAGVFLIVLGATYALIGVKTRWVQIFLSCAFLASIATTALVDYVMNPPVTDAVQGGFFVAIFMTGAVFGGGALVFKEVTEGFACLLGGFCFSMWLLTLRAGGLITSSGGKGAFIGIFCVVFWALSWTSYTRPYALIGSISFSGATAFALGIDCFTRAGLKEFWFYIWDLNDNLFPLNTTTFPLTKGIRVEIAVIVICTIIGVLSQLKLWKVVSSKQREKGQLDEEDFRQREAVEAALGRHLERQNERDKSEWERQYGDRLSSKRNTVLWQNAHPEKRYSTVSVVALEQAADSSSSESVEMNAFGPKGASSTYGSKSKRQSTFAVDVIEEVEEDAEAVANKERQKALQALENARTPLGTERKGSGGSSAAQSTRSASKDVSPNEDAFNDQSGTVGGSSKLKRGSQPSLSRRSKYLSANYGSGNSESQEHLIDGERPLSRASSAAATMDVDNEELDVDALDVDLGQDPSLPPEIVISPVAGPSSAVLRSSENRENAATDVQGAEGSIVGGSLELERLLVDHGGPSANGGSSLDDGLKPEGSDTKTDTGDVKKSQSQTSDATNSSADTLTKTALASVPSQLSSVVLSYRTNEWAKHITMADEPIYDEPETIEGIDDELPTQLASVTTPPKKVAAEPPVELPPTTMLPLTVRAGGSGVGVASKPLSGKRSVSDQERRRSTGRLPSQSASTQSLKHSNSRGGRNSLNPTMQNSLVSTPIDEDAPMEFTNPKRASRRMSAPYQMPQRSNSGTRPHTAYGTASPPSGSVYDLPQMMRPTSQDSNRGGISLGTRLESYNSHQPPQRDHRSDAQKRESLLAEWRLSQQHRAASKGINGAMAESGHAKMKVEKENQRLMEEYQRSVQQRKQLMMDQVMRRPDMQELHREAMRKMQAGANKNLGGGRG
ncbi:uncharacterized protein Z520_09349 [Fonsecaea multimorphosa CBS 102226]|uniref:TM7S3/TM198-like domain-containing protein n=1 Tax=Fonsecaea multimorphosa CBS 102226 TaxID=1442371 RepID=A0A0D2JX06_9EURO|nr:uncharacterized protein Z520_09349 [Fonsecaea multimorphosa CBS 102226]KIX95039.1 hypothetical protein Z520_09349 [Fonsecaea multimorphosa CBS 102226]OAL20684.1 hypothetical protein AYO22_08693 [Fonsecaea multimorphosa]